MMKDDRVHKRVQATQWDVDIEGVRSLTSRREISKLIFKEQQRDWGKADVGAGSVSASKIDFSASRHVITTDEYRNTNL